MRVHMRRSKLLMHTLPNGTLEMKRNADVAGTLKPSALIRLFLLFTWSARSLEQQDREVERV